MTFKALEASVKKQIKASMKRIAPKLIENSKLKKPQTKCSRKTSFVQTNEQH